MTEKIIYEILIRIRIILLCLLAVMFFDAVRLNHAERNTKPLITINETCNESGATYYGLGYSVNYYQELTQTKSINAQGETKIIYQIAGKGAEFKLFNVLPLWSQDNDTIKYL